MKTGQCLCGQIKYEIRGEILYATACHCRMCQRLSGGAFQIWAMVENTGLSISGTPKVFKSSKNVERSFCGTCASHLFFNYLDDSKHRFVTVTSLDNPDTRPKSHMWVDSKLPWLCLDDGIPQRKKEES
jgi:hypothetical protein